MKTLKITFLEDSPNGLREITEDNWSGACRIVSRSHIQKAFEKDNLAESGVYILIGPCDLVGERKLSSKIYIGRADSVDERLAQHHKSKDFWTTAFVFFRKNDPLHAGHTGYLESRLIELATNAGNSVLANAAAPKPPHLNEADIDSMNGFLRHAERVLQALGHDLFTIRQASNEGLKQPTESATFNVPGNLNDLVNSFKEYCLALKATEVYSTQVPDLRAKVTFGSGSRVYASLRLQKHRVRLSVHGHGVMYVNEGASFAGEVLSKLLEAHANCLARLTKEVAD